MYVCVCVCVCVCVNRMGKWWQCGMQEGAAGRGRWEGWFGIAVKSSRGCACGCVVGEEQGQEVVVLLYQACWIGFLG